MTGLKARNIIEAELRRELFGPLQNDGPQGKPIDCSSGSIHFPSFEASRGQFHDASSLQEILNTSDPLRRYGVGVLHSGAAPGGTEIGADESEDLNLTGVTGIAQSEENPSGDPIQISGSLRFDEADSDDFDLTDANTFKPSAMAISFQCRVPVDGSFTVSVTGAYYKRISAHIPGAKQADWWMRKPFELTGTVPGSVLLAEINRLKIVRMTPLAERPAIMPTTQVFSRPVPGSTDPELRLVTVAVTNQVVGTGPSSALFQMGFTVRAEGPLSIEPYPEAEEAEHGDEEQSIELLYRNKRTYAIGHGCAADWGASQGHTSTNPLWVEAVAMPAHEVLSLTPNVYLTDDAGNYILDDKGNRKAVTASMAALAAGSPEGRDQVEMILRLYEEWIEKQKNLIPDLPAKFHQAAERHMKLADEALMRMKGGWQLVMRDDTARRAFQWANEAMLYQQIRSNFPLREVKAGRDDILRPVGAHPEPTTPPGKGTWRPFQITFILASLPELVDPTRPTRQLVDLIYFPTGGGKTEAYLGASSVSLLARRLRDPNDAGTDTLMRYTLRLLTAQQFLRAASLVCVLEEIRDRNEDVLGTSPFGIGIWLGRTSTPNDWKSAVNALGKLRRNSQEQNRFLLLRCPWCGTQMGTKPKARGGQHVIGYEQVGTKVSFRCIDTQCRYSRRNLPVHVVDQDIYDVRPSIVIGTVDKFAMTAWQPMAHRIFGLNNDGARDVSPPGLIIQDELHLISGPLGSMVGLYEPIIDDLCTDRRGTEPVPPKIIASTATVRRYEDQVRGLFGREKVALFPPHGLEEGHSFFAEPATLPDDSPEPGRRYLGIMSASLGSTQTVQVRVAAATLQGAAKIPEADRDGYWTNLNFLNSLRELGNTVSLLESDIPDYLTGLIRRDGINPRWPRRTMELTSRRRADEIPKAIEQLQTGYGQDGCVDICLASNIIEVGVDIDRLGLMTIVGQPKTTAQYIQVSGRIGRRADVSPGLVITIYGASKPRDRSHYERFRTYHQQLYAQVEPTSVTPFAAPVLRRALHAAAVAHVRQTAPRIMPHPFPQKEYEHAIDLLRERGLIVDPDELEILDVMADTRARQWSEWERTEWDANPWGDPKQGLMRFAGTLPDLDSKAMIWDVPTSMRNVDAECRLAVTLAYASDDANLKENGL